MVDFDTGTNNPNPKGQVRFQMQILREGEAMIEQVSQLRAALAAVLQCPCLHDEHGNAYYKVDARSIFGTAHLVKMALDQSIGEHAYAPWSQLGMTESEYWSRRYYEARTDVHKLALTLQFIADCENDGEEMGPIVTVSFLKEQARTILNEVRP